MAQKQIPVSKIAFEVFRSIRPELARARPLDDSMSQSVMIEFLVWWWLATKDLKFEEKPMTKDFKQQTRVGRPIAWEAPTPIAPSTIRAGLGIDSLVQRRKL